MVTDPFSPMMIGTKFPKVEADIVTVSHNHEDHNFTAGVLGNPFVIDNPGEYEIKGISVFGFSSSHNTKENDKYGKNTIYVIEIEGIRICHLGDIGSSLPSKVLEEITGIDVLMIPVGGTFTVGPKEAVELVGQIEPRIVLPMHFKLSSSNENFAKLNTLDEFLKESATPVEKIEKLSLNREKLPSEMKVVILERKE